MTELLWSLIQLFRDSVAESWDMALYFVIIMLLAWLIRIVKRGF